jgi:hypothetical protein
MVPFWLHALSVMALVAGMACAIGLAIHETRHPSKMWIMTIVWPIAALFAAPVALMTYAAQDKKHAKLSAESIITVSFHCGAGCALGDILAEWLAMERPAVLTWFGWHSLFGDRMFATWGLDFVFAFVLGIAFQYFAIGSMKKPGAGLIAALKADALSLIAWQAGMYSFMALAQFAVLGPVWGIHLRANTPVFWFAMQLAMRVGLLTALPVNAWLLKAGIKEPM